MTKNDEINTMNEAINTETSNKENSDISATPNRKVAGVKEIDAAKTSRIPIKIIPMPTMRKPDWIRMKVPDSARFQEIKKILRDNNLHTVCEEASCPNIGECFSGGTATFMISGSATSGGRGLPCATSQNGQRRVQISPKIIKVAVPPLKHSPMLGQLASSHTVCRLLSRRIFLIS